MLYNPCGVCYGAGVGLVCLGFLCRYVPLCEDKKEEYV